MADNQVYNILKKLTQREGIWRDLYENIRLIFLLMKDKRVSSWLKLMPINAVIYLLVPFDFLPIIPIDDGLVLWLSGYLFIELCPSEIVEEHRKYLQSGKRSESKVSEVIDAAYREAKSDQD
jgi:uncharacterized membrane protein YkvA (DUF1232 family)